MNEREIDSKFDEIVAFAEVDDFLDTPVKRYSSGMSMRLAFSVAAHLEPEILLVDEVLAVGDAAFQKKCLGKMGDVAQEGRTVLFVSHNMGAIRSLCGRAIWVNQGQIFMDGDPSQIISNYLSATVSQSGEGQIVWDNDFDAPGGEELKLRAIRLIGPEGKVLSLFEVEKPIHIEISYEVKKLLRGMRIHLSLLTPQGEVAFQSTDYKIRPEQVNPGYYRSVCTIPGELLNIGKYVVRVGGGIPGIKRLLPAREYLSFDTAGHGNQGSNYPERWPGVVCPRLDWRIEKTELESR
jgi:lipopolysaccharide transport system ATP-binding protein